MSTRFSLKLERAPPAHAELHVICLWLLGLWLFQEYTLYTTSFHLHVAQCCEVVRIHMRLQLQLHWQCKRQERAPLKGHTRTIRGKTERIATYSSQCTVYYASIAHGNFAGAVVDIAPAQETLDHQRMGW